MPNNNLQDNNLQMRNLQDNNLKMNNLQDNNLMSNIPNNNLSNFQDNNLPISNIPNNNLINLKDNANYNSQKTITFLKCKIQIKIIYFNKMKFIQTKEWKIQMHY